MIPIVTMNKVPWTLRPSVKGDDFLKYCSSFNSSLGAIVSLIKLINGYPDAPSLTITQPGFNGLAHDTLAAFARWSNGVHTRV